MLVQSGSGTIYHEKLGTRDWKLETFFVPLRLGYKNIIKNN